MAQFFFGGSGGSGGFPFGGNMGGMGGPPRKKETKFYDMLGASRDDTCEAIKRKFKKLARTCHPDKGGDPTKFQELSQAADVLSDPKKREVYDQYGEEGINKGMSDQPEYGGMFGGNQRDEPDEPEQCPSCTFELAVTLEDVYAGKLSKIAIRRTRICNTCFGFGGSRRITCTNCKGTGSVQVQKRMGPMTIPARGKCQRCHGKGEIPDPAYICGDCNGNRTIKEKKVIEVPIERGVTAGKRIPFPGESDEEPGKTPGDLIVVIQEKKHPVYTRKGNDLFMAKKLSLSEALTGFRFPLNHADGRQRLIQSLPGELTAPNETKMYANLGLPTSAAANSFGHLFITYSIEFPQQLEYDIDQRNFLKSILPSARTEAIDMSDFNENTKHIAASCTRSK